MDPFMVEAFTLLSIGIGVIFLRTFTRIRQVGIRELEADDYLMLAAIIPYATETVLAYSVGAFYHGLTNSGMTSSERAALSPSDEEYIWRVSGSKVQVAGWCMYVTVLWVIKAALCAFYLRLTVSPVPETLPRGGLEPRLVTDEHFAGRAGGLLDPDPSGIRPDRRDVYCPHLRFPLQLSSDAPLLADLPRPRK